MSTLSTDLLARFHSHIDQIDPAQWNALRADDNPFVSHEFLHALERTGCVRVDYGWQAHHLALYDGETLVAAAPLYLKGNSHGEFVFDWSWASAWERAGGDYYPKLLNAVPYSPVTGPRLLVGTGPEQDTLRRTLTTAMRDEADRMGLSSVHANFLGPNDLSAFGEEWLERSDVQFHWRNRDYAHFPAFLSALNHKKRKNIRHERRQVALMGLAIETRSGASLTVADWHRVHALYAATFDEKGNHAALTREFFVALGEVLGEAVQVVLARDGETIVAMALLIRSHDTLYGRYWGACVEVPGLHFELCYYRGIDYAIQHGLRSFEPGAQGEHKLARGFLPTRTQSRHYLAHPQFRRAVSDALVHESQALDAYANELSERSPYAHRADSADAS